MGLLNLFAKPPTKLLRLPSGSFTVDQTGRVLASTLPQAFPVALVEDIGAQVLTAFRVAQAAKLPFSEVIIRYSSLKLTARELRGGAIIFVAPQTLATTTQ
ncbi:MAG: hypothetical protein JWR19_397 [Pedosphaera sp.]|nr:hypothetical protein [Pedosphaera sp.]